MSRSRSNCNVIRVWPVLLVEVISVIPAICPKYLSKGPATLVDTVTGSAPGNDADTEIVG